MNHIQHIVEPKRLILAWQSPGEDNRTRHAVGELLAGSDGVVLQYYNRSHPDVIAALKLGYVGYPAFKLDRREHRTGVMEVFLRRLPPRSRKDFREYLEAFRLSAVSSLSDMALLGYTGAKLPSDGFTLVHPFENVTGQCEFLIEVSGYRKYVPTDTTVEIGHPVRFVSEPTNEWDPNAIAVYYDELKIGFVNRLQTHAFHGWLADARLSAVIEKINGQTGRPRAYAFVKVAPLHSAKVA